MNKILKKIRGKILQIIHHNLPYNLSFRPVDYYSSSKEYLNSLDKGYYKVIYPSYHFKLDIPADLYDAYLFERPVQAMELPDVVVAAVPNGRLYSDAYNTVAIMTENNILLRDLSLELRDKGRLGGCVNDIFNVKYFAKPRYFPGHVFSLLSGGGGIDNYFHWLFDVITRLHLLKESGFYDNIDWFLVPDYRLPYQIETLSLLGIPNSKIITGEETIHLRADVLIASSPHRNARQMEAWECKFLRGTFLKLVPLDAKRRRRYIYVTRNDSKSRNVLNELELMNLLASYEFEKVSLSGMSFAHQVQLFHGADIIISPHGAGLANLVFCRTGTKVIEIFSQLWFGPFYHAISMKVGLDYRYSLSRVTQKPSVAKVGKHQHFYADIHDIDNLLQKFLRVK